jgi:hypothetical protein
MVAGGPALFALGRVLPAARALFVLLTLAYAVLGVLASRGPARKAGASLPLTLAASATMHLTYGAGFIAGWWRERRSLRAGASSGAAATLGP